MTYELIIDEGKEKQVIAFLKQLDFVQIRQLKAKNNEKIISNYKDAQLPYFATDANWEDIKDIRKKSTVKRLSGW